MKHSGRVLLFSLVLITFGFFANVQSGAPAGRPANGWITETAEQAVNSDGVQPVTALGKGFSVVPQSRGLRRIPSEPEEPMWKETIVPGVIRPYVVTQDAADRLPLKMAAPPLQKNFDGLKFQDLYPSDTTLAVGPTAMVAAVNAAFAIYNKTGAKLAYHTFDDWFSVLTDINGAFLYDPKLAYDAGSGHFIMIVDAKRDSDKRAWFLLAVSQTSDPSGVWYLWALDQGLNGNIRTKNWVDYPAIGFDQDAIYLSGNTFNFADRYLYAKLRILNKAEVLQFGTIHWRDFWNLRDASGQLSFTVEAARSTGAPSGESMISVNRLQGSSITLWNVMNPTTAPVITKKKVLITGFQVAPDAEQKGGGSMIATNDARMSDAVWINGSIFAAHTVAHDWGSGTVSAIRFYEIRSSDGALMQDGTFGADGSYYFFPAIATDTRGNQVVVFIRTSSQEFVSVRFTGRKATDQPAILQSSSPIKTGIRNYYLLPDNGVERWGDYCGVSLDSDNSVWMYGMYAASPADEWRTRVGKTRFP